MPKNQYISFILLLILVATVVNLFYKHRLSAPYEKVSAGLRTLLHPVTKALCPLHGFKCPTDQLCDCGKYCSNGENFSAFRVRSYEERVYVMNEKLGPGAYCLPKGVETCDMATTVPVFSLAGWSCLPLDHALFRDGKEIACRNEEAANHDLNVLWDHAARRPVSPEEIGDYYETLGPRLRYGCRCASKSLDGTPMLSVLPFTCSVDYCLRDIPNPLEGMGFNGRGCECALYDHLDKDDETSPCVSKKTGMIDEHGTFLGRIDCIDRHSIVPKPLFCPPTTMGGGNAKHVTFRVTLGGDVWNTLKMWTGGTGLNSQLQE